MFTLRKKTSTLLATTMIRTPFHYGPHQQGPENPPSAPAPGPSQSVSTKDEISRLSPSIADQKLNILQAPNSQEKNPTSKKELNYASIAYQVYDALQIAVQGIAVQQIVIPVKESLDLKLSSPVSKVGWNVPSRGTFQDSISACEATSISAQKQKALILQNNPNWDRSGHPFPESSIDLFKQQIVLLNEPFSNPVVTMQKMIKLENQIADCFIRELGPVDGLAGYILHKSMAKAAAMRIVIMYAPSLDDAHHDDPLTPDDDVLAAPAPAAHKPK